jgi:prevent-host-death family protein
MRYSTNIKPISYGKAHAAEVLDAPALGGEPMVITQNGEVRAVLRDVKSCEATQETMALLKLLAPAPAGYRCRAQPKSGCGGA